MNNKHTPGPWHYIAGDIIADNGTLVARIQQGIADGRIIAAAPDLLVTCEWAAAILDGYAPPVDDDAAKRYDSGYIVLRAAIAKARGES